MLDYHSSSLGTESPEIKKESGSFGKVFISYVNSFPNLQFQKGLCDSYGLDVEYKEKYFKRMYRWFTLGDTLYEVTPKKRGSQTS